MEEGTLKKGDKVNASIENNRRQLIARNHTATHLLHWALRLVLGSHVKQSGSLVGHDRLRFDFTHFHALTDEELKKVEKLVNQKIIENHPVRCYITTQEYARDIGAIALFGEKYDEFVRVVESGDFHKELCGGTHITSTGEIGLVKIISESSVGANLRRLEAVTSRMAIDLTNKEEEILRELEEKLETSYENLPKRVETLLEELNTAQKHIRKYQNKKIKEELELVLKKSEVINDQQVIISKVPSSNMEEMRHYSDLIRDKAKSCIVLLGTISRGKSLLLAAVTKDIIEKGFSSKDLIQKIAPIVGGGGGGKPDLAQAGGQKTDNLDQALVKGKDFIKKFLSGEKA